MITGLLVEVSSEELEEHLRAKGRHHEDKVDFYSEQVTALEKSGDNWSSQTNNPIYSLEQTIKSHVARGAFFKFLADHIVKNETYRLSEGDLGRVELIDRAF